MPMDLPGTSIYPIDRAEKRKCPSCGRTYSAAAIKKSKQGKILHYCPHCGRQVDTVSAQDIPTLVNALEKDTDRSTRAAAAQMLGQTDNPESLRKLVRVLKQDKEFEVRASAAESLSQVIDTLEKADNQRMLVRDSLITALREDQSVKVRAAAALALGKISDDMSAQAIIAALDDTNYHVRSAAACASGNLRSMAAISHLSAILTEDSEVNVRVAAAEAMGRIGSPESIPPLSRAVGDSEVEVRTVAVVALGRVGTAAAIPAISRALDDVSNDNHVRIKCLEAFSRIGLPEPIPQIGIATQHHDLAVRKAALSALGSINHPSVINWLNRILCSDDDVDLRIDAANTIAKIDHPDTISVLVNAYLQINDPKLRREVSDLVNTSQSTDWRGKTDVVIKCLQESKLRRQDIDSSAITQMIAIPSNDQAAGNGYALTDYLIIKALGQDDRMTGNLAILITESAGRSPDDAACRMEEYERKHPETKEGLRKLRIAVGGEKAITPLMQVLQTNLETNFQVPIKELNTNTRDMWQKTIRYAQYGFLARITMSVIVFGVGITLLIVSSLLFMFGHLSLEELVGPGVSFVSGWGMMLLIIYSGPLKEIRQSVSDLGVSSAAFIAYVHRVLETSHTFAYFYLKEQITLDQLKASGELIEKAMTETVRALRPLGKISSDEIIQQAVNQAVQAAKLGNTNGTTP
jgi:HEAT repeat protein